MSRFTVLAASGLLASAMMAAPAFAQQDPTCYNPNVDGPVNTNALPFCQDYLPANDQYQTLDRTTVFRGTPCSGANCPPPADLSNVQPFYGGTASAPVPAPAPAPAPVPATTVVQTAQAAAAPPVYGAVPFQAAGLSNTALAAGAVGAAALAGLIAIIASDSDGSSGSSTTTTTTP